MKISIKRTFKLLTVGLSLILLASCSSRPENLALVPKDTNFIATTNLTSIATKGGMQNLEQFNFYKSFGKEMTKESPIMKKMVENPFFTGISYTSDILMFPIDQKIVCISIDLSSGEKFTAFVDEMIKESGMPMKIEDKENFKSVSLQGAMMLAWDDTKALMAMPSGMGLADLDAETTRLFNLKESENINSNKEFDTFYDEKRDLNVWMSTQFIEDLPMGTMMMSQMPNYMKNNFISMHLGFESDQIIVSSAFSPNSNMVKEMKKYNIYGNGFNSDLLKYFPKDSYVSISGAVNPEGYYDMMTSQPQFEEAMKMVSPEIATEIEGILQSFKGSMLFSIHGFDTSSAEPMPLMTLAFDMNDSEKIDSLMTTVPTETYSKVDGYYTMELEEGISAYMIYDDKMGMVTNDKSRIDAFKNGGESGKNLGDSDIASKIKNNAMYMQMNAKMDDYPANIQSLISQGAGIDLMQNINQYFTGMEVYATDDYKGEYIIYTGEDGTNSLFKMIKAIDDNIFALMGAF